MVYKGTVRGGARHSGTEPCGDLMKQRIAFLLCALATMAGLQGARADSIVWVGTDFPPMSMSQGEHARQGYLDQMVLFLKEALPQHDFREDTVPWTRALKTMRDGGPYCMAAAFQTPERSQFMRFTEPYGYLMPVGVVVPAKDRAHFLPYVTSDEHIRLSAMLQDTKLHIGVANGRSYGPVIDGLLEPLLQSGAAHVQKVYQGESTKTLTTMLGLNRFHYMLAYPIEAVFYQEPGNALLFYPVEGGDQLLEGRFGCTKGAETDRVFADVAQLVGSKKTWQPFLTAYERWLPPTLIKQYRKKLANLPKH